MLTRRFPLMLTTAAAISVLTAVVGIYASYYWDASTGASVVLAQSAVFALAYLFAPQRGVLAQWRIRHAQRRIPAGAAR